MRRQLRVVGAAVALPLPVVETRGGRRRRNSHFPTRHDHRHHRQPSTKTAGRSAAAAASHRAIVRDAGIAAATISVAIVDDPTIAKLHQQFLDDPEPTDVLSFVLERRPRCSKAKWSSAPTPPRLAPRGTAARPRRNCCVRHPRHAAPGRLRRHDAAKAGRHAKTREPVHQ